MHLWNISVNHSNIASEWGYIKWSVKPKFHASHINLLMRLNCSYMNRCTCTEKHYHIKIRNVRLISFCSLCHWHSPSACRNFCFIYAPTLLPNLMIKNISSDCVRSISLTITCTIIWLLNNRNAYTI